MASVLRTLNAATVELDHLLADLNVYSHADTGLRAIAAAVAGAALQAPAVAIGAILLSQIGGRYAIRHCVETAALVALAARQLGQSHEAVLTATAAALTMNVGMLREIDALHARASVLDTAERERIRRHPVDGAALLRCAGVDDQDWIDCVLQHHEAADGSGYPAGLCSGDIALNASLVGMADRYCAAVGARNYRRSLLAPAALAILERDNAGHPAQVAAFSALLGPYPPGTLVRLTDGAIGVVAASEPKGLRVQVLRMADGSPSAIQRPAATIETALHEDEARLRFAMQAVWGEDAAL